MRKKIEIENRTKAFFKFREYFRKIKRELSIVRSGYLKTITREIVAFHAITRRRKIEKVFK